MKKCQILVFFLFLTLASCTTQRSVAHQQQVERLPPSVETSAYPLTLTAETDLELAIQLVKLNSPSIRKYFIQDESREIHVKGELLNSNGEVDYEIAYEFPLPSHPEAYTNGRIYIGFTVEEKKTGKSVSDSFYWLVPSSNAGLLLSFDDNFEGIWEIWLDILEEYNARATFFVHKFSPFSETALARGHDIGFHTHEHTNLRTASREVFRYETSYDPDEFRLGRPMSFAYPYGLWDEWMHEELLQHFSLLRGYGVRFRLYDFDAISGSFISSTAIDNTLYQDDAEFERFLTIMLRTTKFLGGVLPLTTHNISDTAAWGIKTYRLIFLLESARKLNLNFYRFSDF